MFDRINHKVHPVKHINIDIDESIMIIDSVEVCLDPSLIVIVMRTHDKSDFLTLVWDLIKNNEVSNYSSKSFRHHINGSNSKAGYL